MLLWPNLLTQGNHYRLQLTISKSVLPLQPLLLVVAAHCFALLRCVHGPLYSTALCPDSSVILLYLCMYMVPSTTATCEDYWHSVVNAAW